MAPNEMNNLFVGENTLQRFAYVKSLVTIVLILPTNAEILLSFLSFSKITWVNIWWGKKKAAYDELIIQCGNFIFHIFYSFTMVIMKMRKEKMLQK